MIRVAIGGPVHRDVSPLSERTVIRLLARARQYGARVVHCQRERGCSIDLNRCRLMSAALATNAEWLLSLDADAAVDDVDQLFRMMVDCPRDAPLIAAPAEVTRAGHWNIIADGVPLLARPDGVQVVDCVGFGVVAFNLAWYRKHWPDGMAPWFQTEIQYEIGAGWQKYTEDYHHCDVLRSGGANILVDGRVTVQHPA